jgi:hypothetical protein
VVFCPDQLGPAVNRLLPDDIRQVTYPLFGSPERVDWVDYADRNRRADPAAFVDQLLDGVSPNGAVWVVANGGYRTLEGQCDALVARLGEARPGLGAVVSQDGSNFAESASLFRAPPVAP